MAGRAGNITQELALPKVDSSWPTQTRECPDPATVGARSRRTRRHGWCRGSGQGRRPPSGAHG